VTVFKILSLAHSAANTQYRQRLVFEVRWVGNLAANLMPTAAVIKRILNIRHFLAVTWIRLYCLHLPRVYENICWL